MTDPNTDIERETTGEQYVEGNMETAEGVAPDGASIRISMPSATTPRTRSRPTLASGPTRTTCLCATMARRPTALHEGVGGKVTHAGPCPENQCPE
jgi:hypothetical protein